MIKIILLVFPVTEKFIIFFLKTLKKLSIKLIIYIISIENLFEGSVLSCIKKQKQRSLILSSRATQFTAGFSEVFDKKKSISDEKKYCPYCGHKIDRQ